ncbi:MAG: RNA methyltransferase [Prevotellaceae bacterium]|nr:RNA methyltransferase [Candidatus Colivivens equi]MCQ2076551.1 RNA methyltransferase [Bacteroidaceae bacterium]
MISKAKIKYIKSLALKKYRDKDDIFVAEGPKIITELERYFEIIDKYDGEDADKASLLDTPQHSLALFRKRKEDVGGLHTPTRSELCLMLHDIQNPGNLGTIVRLADWFGIEHIYCSTGCADIYNPKTIQATMGAIARVHIHYVDLQVVLQTLPKDYPIYGTFLEGEDIYSADLSVGGMIIMGNEGHGISDELSSHVTHRLLIPNYPSGRETAESLNVAIATAIVCSEFRRRC